MALGTTVHGMQDALQPQDEPALALCLGKPQPSGALGVPTQAKHSILRHTELTLVLRASDALGSTQSPLALIPRSWELLGPTGNGRH